MATASCPCGTGQDYESCCGPVHRQGAGLGTAAVALMRARYSAYVRNDERFLLDSWAPETRPGSVTLDPRMSWLGLEIVETVGGGGFDTEGFVEFRARFEIGSEPGELHERSRFIRSGGAWTYVDGV